MVLWKMLAVGRWMGMGSIVGGPVDGIGFYSGFWLAGICINSEQLQTSMCMWNADCRFIRVGTDGFRR